MNFSSEAVNVQGDALSALYNAGYLRFYTLPLPASIAEAISTQTLLGSVQLDNPAAGAAVDGLVTFSGMPKQVAGSAAGDIAFCRAFKTDGTTGICDLSVSTTAGDVIVDKYNVEAGGFVKVLSFQLQVPKQ